MRTPKLGYALSIALHFGVAGGVNSIPKNIAHKSTAVTMMDAKPKPKDKPKSDDKPKPPEPPESHPIKVPRAAPKPAPAPAAPQNTPPPPVRQSATPPPSAAMNAMPDFGISMGGLASGGGGIAVPMGGGGSGEGGDAAGRGGRRAEGGGGSHVGGPKPKQTGADEVCDDDVVKPKPLGSVQPQYTDDARAAGIEGKVKLQLTVDASGSVTAVELVKGLGHGLDQSAIAAAKRMKFSPATRCKKPVESTLVISVRFQLGE